MINDIDAHLQRENRYSVRQQQLEPQAKVELRRIYDRERHKRQPDIADLLAAFETNFPGFTALFHTDRLQKSTLSGREKIEVVESQIYRVSASFVNEGRLAQLDFKMSNMAQLPQLISGQKEKSYIQEITRQWETNKANTDRNYFLRDTILTDPNLEKSTPKMLAQNPNFYSVGVVPSHHFMKMVEGGVAAFGKEVRKLILQDPGLDQSVFPDFSDLLALIHELTHASQDSEMLARFAPKSADEVKSVRKEIFAEVQKTKTRTLIVLNHEVEAASNEAAIFDALTRSLGALRTDVMACMQRLSWPPNLQKHLQHYIALAEHYRKSPEAVIEYTKRRYAGIGAPFFHVSKKGVYELGVEDQMNVTT